jgi:ERF superfamily protein
MTDNNVVQMKEPPAALRPAQYIEEAIAKGAGIDVIEKLIALQERWDANQAKKAFNAAIAAFKSNPPEILKSVQVGYDSKKGGSHTSYKHEDLAELMSVVDPALAEHGLWVRFKIDSGDKVTVICVVGHSDGYSEEASKLSAAPDTSGSKNHIQAIGSTVTYLQRYTLKAALGLAAAKDDDGRGAGKWVSSAVSDEQADTINKLLLENFSAKAVETFLKMAGAPSVSDIMAVKYDSCIRYLNRQIEAAAAKKAKK